jgi:proteasome lid subunit RPN8/RPN11
LYRRGSDDLVRGRVLDNTSRSDAGVTTELAIVRSTYDALLEHLLAALPNEGCGLLATVDDGAVRRVTRFFPGENIDCSPTRFTMDPRQVAAAMVEIDAFGWHLGGIVHSHPRTPARPSATDLREAYYPDALLVITSFAATEPELRSWDVSTATTLDESREVAITIVPD